MPRVRTQLNIQVSADFLTRIRSVAESQGRTVTSLALQWLEAGLAGDRPADDGAAVSVRLAALEARLSALEARQSAPVPPACVAPAPVETTPALFAMEGEVSQPLTSAELAEQTGTSRASWNNWASRNPVGSVRVHPAAGPWRLAGQRHEPRKGGPPRWLWEPA